MKDYLESLRKAAHDTAAYMTMDARKSALSHGWSKDEAKAIKVKFSEGKFDMKLTGKHATAAHIQEFGDEGKPPTAAARKYANTPGKSGEYFMQRFNKHIGGKKDV